jgi:hypothetical protein
MVLRRGVRYPMKLAYSAASAPASSGEGPWGQLGSHHVAMEGGGPMCKPASVTVREREKKGTNRTIMRRAASRSASRAASRSASRASSRLASHLAPRKLCPHTRLEHPREDEDAHPNTRPVRGDGRLVPELESQCSVRSARSGGGGGGGGAARALAHVSGAEGPIERPVACACAKGASAVGTHAHLPRAQVEPQTRSSSSSSSSSSSNRTAMGSGARRAPKS